MVRRIAPLGVLVAAACAATPANAQELLNQRLTAPDAQKRVCHTQLAQGAGVVQQRVDPAVDSLVRARLQGSDGDWDLGLFDAKTGRSIGGSAAFGTAELAEAFANSPVVVQACRRSGEGGTPRLTVTKAELPAPSGQRRVAQLVNISTPTDESKERLQALGLDLTEHGHNGSLEAVIYGAADEAKLRNAGFQWVVEIPDLAKRSLENRAADVAYSLRVGRSGMPSGRTQYRQLADFEAEMKALAEGNPNLVKPLVLPNRSLEGRQVQGVEITEGAQNTADGKPVFVQLGVHHAREWPSGEMPMEFAHDLVKGFGKDARTTRLVKAVRTIVVPVVNVDGYSLSRASEPYDLRATGTADPILQPFTEGTLVDSELNNTPGHLVAVLADSQSPFFAYKRRNCRTEDGRAPTEGECAKPGTSTVGGSRDLGVDPNRNYGGFWGGPGASESPNVDTYRGPAPFSEPETQNIKALVSSRQVTTLITNHTYSDLVLRPPGLKAQGPPPDEPVYKALGDGMAAQNGYVSQKSYELYDTTGTTEDWSYYATGGLGFTFEIGEKEFHPPYQDVVAEYVGKDEFEGQGNREAYFVALESTANTARHSVIAGKAKPGTTLKLSKAFTTFTSPVRSNPNDPESAGAAIGFADRLESSYTVPASGVVDWHVNPSTRPVVRGSFLPNVAASPTRSEKIESSPTVPAGGSPNPASIVEQEFDVTEADARELVKVRIDWESADDDFDMQVFRLQEGGRRSEVGKSATPGGQSTFEEILLPTPLTGRYVIRVVNYAATNPDFTGSVDFFAPGPVKPTARTTETWTLTCPDGRSSQVAVERGQRFDAGRVCGGEPEAVEQRRVVLSGGVPSRGGATGNGTGPATAKGLKWSVVVDRRKLRDALRRGLRAKGSCTTACRLTAALSVDRRTARRLGLRSTTIARGSAGRTFSGQRAFRIAFSREARRRLARSRSVSLSLVAQATDAQGKRGAARRTLSLKR